MLKKFFIFLITFYRKRISAGLKSSCIYTPTCSAYALDALKKHTFFYALILIIYRVLRCNPLSRGGLDPVPDRKSDVKWLI